MPYSVFVEVSIESQSLIELIDGGLGVLTCVILEGEGDGQPSSIKADFRQGLSRSPLNPDFQQGYRKELYSGMNFLRSADWAIDLLSDSRSGSDSSRNSTLGLQST